MAYVGNIVAFVKFMIENIKTGYNVYNYIDKPDFTMNDLVLHVEKVLNKHIPSTHFPYWMGMLGGYYFDLMTSHSRLSKRILKNSINISYFINQGHKETEKI